MQALRTSLTGGSGGGEAEGRLRFLDSLKFRLHLHRNTFSLQRMKHILCNSAPTKMYNLAFFPFIRTTMDPYAKK